jgi:hypothetical protein
MNTKTNRRSRSRSRKLVKRKSKRLVSRKSSITQFRFKTPFERLRSNVIQTNEADMIYIEDNFYGVIFALLNTNSRTPPEKLRPLYNAVLDDYREDRRRIWSNTELTNNLIEYLNKVYMDSAKLPILGLVLRDMFFEYPSGASLKNKDEIDELGIKLSILNANVKRRNPIL